jgi:hypothetical protein
MLGGSISRGIMWVREQRWSEKNEENGERPLRNAFEIALLHLFDVPSANSSLLHSCYMLYAPGGGAEATSTITTLVDIDKRAERM